MELGNLLGKAVGTMLGAELGTMLGITLGTLVGDTDGAELGRILGVAVLGSGEGMSILVMLGLSVGEVLLKISSGNQKVGLFVETVVLGV
jgi:hypothetical protein